MVIIPPPAPDVVEAVGRMTGVALIDPGLLPGGSLRHHAEVLHEVAGRGFVTFHALGRIGRRVPVAFNFPGAGTVTAGTIGTELTQMLVSDRMAARTIERGFGHRPCFSGRARRGRLSPDLRIEQCGMVHPNNPPIALMLEMARTAFGGLRVKHGRLLVSEIRTGVA